MTKKRLLIYLTFALISLGLVGSLFFFLPELEPSVAGPAEDPDGLPALARRQIGVTVSYAPDYVVIDFPGGDVPMETGVCTDVIIRALRLKGIDLQQLVNEDMEQNFRLYPGRKLWRQRAADSSIDHRRVPNLELFFERIGWSVTDEPTDNPEDYLAGDIVTCYDAAHGRPHIMIVSDRCNEEGIPQVIHNSGKGTEENNDLFEFPVSAHFRPYYGEPISLPQPEPKQQTKNKKR